MLLLASFRGGGCEKTFSTPIVTFESTTDSIPSSHVHFPSATSTTPSISIAAQDFAQSSYDVSLISDDSSINDSTYLSSPSFLSNRVAPLLGRLDMSIDHLDHHLLSILQLAPALI
ncbi:hypothetical protein ARMSODRAFT_1026424 [Armillaria solidipes]|uniref:Uncharacterized protein n=1 Tax=Armillaria solidipes TaxID=1076256 RepID=A0A2H3BBW2_9AGAR|nr:hypothetical protein ARMSODRAFT_1026424 [Armillaria solidipes]